MLERLVQQRPMVTTQSVLSLLLAHVLHLSSSCDVVAAAGQSRGGLVERIWGRSRGLVERIWGQLRRLLVLWRDSPAAVLRETHPEMVRYVMYDCHIAVLDVKHTNRVRTGACRRTMMIESAEAEALLFSGYSMLIALESRHFRSRVTMLHEFWIEL